MGLQEQLAAWQSQFPNEEPVIQSFGSKGPGGALGGLASPALRNSKTLGKIGRAGVDVGVPIWAGLLGGLGAGAISGGMKAPPATPGAAPTGNGASSGGIWDKIKGGIGGMGGKLGDLGSGALGKIRGMLPGGGGGAPAPQPPAGGIPSSGDWAKWAGAPGDAPASGGGGVNGLAGLAGLGLLGAGLAQGDTTPDIEDIFAGAPEQTSSMLAAQQSAEQQRRQAAEDQYLGRRATARTTIDQILGQGSDEAMRSAIQSRQEQLNRQGLLSGPSGAMDFALAQEGAKLRREQLPALLQFENQTETGLNSMRGAGVAGDIDLGRAGLSRQFGLSDTQRSSKLYDRLKQAEEDRKRKSALLRTGSEAIGYGLGGTEGAETGGNIGRRLEDILG